MQIKIAESEMIIRKRFLSTAVVALLLITTTLFAGCTSYTERYTAEFYASFSEPLNMKSFKDVLTKYNISFDTDTDFDAIYFDFLENNTYTSGNESFITAATTGSAHNTPDVDMYWINLYLANPDENNSILYFSKYGDAKRALPLLEPSGNFLLRILEESYNPSPSKTKYKVV